MSIPLHFMKDRDYMSLVFWISRYGFDMKVVLELPSQLVVSKSDTKLHIESEVREKQKI